MATQVFLSYAGEDRALAEPIFLALTGRGYDVFFDRDDLHPGADFLERIKQAVNSCDLFVFLVTPHSLAEGSFTLTELEYAKKRWKHPKDQVVTVMAGKVPLAEVPPYLVAVTVLEPVGNLAAAVVDAVAALKPPKQAARATAAPRRGSLTTRWLRPGAMAPLLVAIVGAGGAIVAALIVRPPPPPSQWSATIDDCDIEPSPSTVSEYVSRMNTPEEAAKVIAGYAPERRQALGRTISYRVHFVGPPKERYPVHLRLFDAATRRRIKIRDDEEAVPVVKLWTDTDDDRFRDVVWFEPMTVVKDHTQKLFVELEVRNMKNNQPMAKCTTPEFDLQ